MPIEIDYAGLQQAMTHHDPAAGTTILNFAHPLTPAQLQQIEELTGAAVERVMDIATQMQHGEPFDVQVRRLLNQIDPTGQLWQTEGLVVNPPGYAPAAAVLLAELHGRIGHFPAIVRLRPVAGSTPTRYEVAEVINLQAVRDRSRKQRH